MSGGSFNYASIDTSNLEDLVEKRSEWERLRDAFEEIEADDVAAEIDATLKYIDVVNRRIIARMDRLRDVAQAMEWWKSCDYSRGQVDEAIKEYRGEA